MSQNADNCLILETHPTLPRFGTDLVCGIPWIACYV